MRRYRRYDNTPRDVEQDSVNVSTNTYSKRDVSGQVHTIIEKMQNNEYVELAYIIQSFTDPTKKYVVSRLSNGDWQCTCPMFKMNIPRKKYLHKAYKLPSGQLVCKHVAWVYQNMRVLTPVIDRTNGRDIITNDYAINIVDLNRIEGRIVSVGRNIVEERAEPQQYIQDTELGNLGQAQIEDEPKELKFNFTADDIIFLDSENSRTQASVEEKEHKVKDIEIGF